MENGEIKHFVEFQYKICYSKIGQFTMFELAEFRFQYKICYSKIDYLKLFNLNINKFQYKICYSKMPLISVHCYACR